MKVVLSVALFSALALIVGGLAGWFARGFHEETSGKVFVVTTLEQPVSIALTFPNGTTEAFELSAGGIFSFVNSSTGEGGIQVAVDGIDRGSHGYVTSINPPVLIVIGEDRINFSYLVENHKRTNDGS